MVKCQENRGALCFSRSANPIALIYSPLPAHHSMARHRRNKPDALEFLPPLVGIVLLGLFFVPGFKQLLGSLLVVVLIVGALTLASLIGWKLYKKSLIHPFPSVKMPPPVSMVSSNMLQLPVHHRRGGEALHRDWSVELLRDLEWKRFEDVVAAYIQELGQIARTTRIGPDGEWMSRSWIRPPGRSSCWFNAKRGMPIKWVSNPYANSSV